MVVTRDSVDFKDVGCTTDGTLGIPDTEFVLNEDVAHRGDGRRELDK